MPVRRLQISGIRNLERVQIDECTAINIFTGLNGSGKTSVLESIFMLARARSFRSGKLTSVINHLATRCVVFGEITGPSGTQTAGVMRSRGEQQVFKINGNPVHSASQLAELLPLQLVNADTFSILEGGPKVRRQFLDWGVFHVEQEFLFYWKRIQKALKHRNSLLRHGKILLEDLSPWDTELCLCAEMVDGMRRQYMQQLQPYFDQVLARLVSLSRVELQYRRGWSEDLGLQQVLAKDFLRDAQHGVTHAGPHRADIEIRVEGRLAEDVLSRGQEKLLVCALRIAQGMLLHERTGKSCVYLVDDLPAELDMQRRQALCRQLSTMNSQVFITATDPESMRDCWDDPTQVTWFHVERGQITPTTACLSG